jgi:hypothetical protein
MTIRLHVRRMRVVRVVEDQFDKLVIEVADTRRVVWYPACGCKTSKVHETRRVEIRDLPRAGRRRLCGCSGASSAPMWTSTHTEDHPEIEGKVARRLAPMAGAGLEIPHDPGSCRAGTACRGT